MDLVTERTVKDVPDLRHRVRQLRWFKASFRQHTQVLARRYRLSIRIDDVRLTEAFLNWAERFQVERDYAKLDRRDFVTFTAGLLLRELLRSHPVGAAAFPAAESATEQGVTPSNETWPIAQAWPEGFICTNYCICILAAVLEQEGMTMTLPALADDLRTWLSYRENVGEDPSRAIAFLDLMTGTEPNWFMPDSVASRSAMKRATAARLLPVAPAEAV